MVYKPRLQFTCFTRLFGLEYKYGILSFLAQNLQNSFLAKRAFGAELEEALAQDVTQEILAYDENNHSSLINTNNHEPLTKTEGIEQPSSVGTPKMKAQIKRLERASSRRGSCTLANPMGGLSLCESN